jgi:exonuclease VII small subunit
MVSSQKSEDFEQVVEKIVFDEEELDELKIIIRKFTEGKIHAKQLKQKLLQSRGRMVKDISNFLSFCVDRIKSDDQIAEVPKITINNQSNQTSIQLQQDLIERNELLTVIAKKVNHIVEKEKKINF